MKNNKEYYFHKSIESVDDAVDALRGAGYAPGLYRRCDLEGQTNVYRVMITDLAREYEVLDLNDCLKFIVNDAVMLGKMVDTGSIVEELVPRTKEVVHLGKWSATTSHHQTRFGREMVR